MGKTLVPLQVLCAEGFAESPFAMLRIAVDRGLALALDQQGPAVFGGAGGGSAPSDAR